MLNRIYHLKITEDSNGIPAPVTKKSNPVTSYTTFLKCNLFHSSRVIRDVENYFFRSYIYKYMYTAASQA